MSVGILGTGSYLPKDEISNSDIADLAGVTDEWILRKTGIQTRRYAAPDEATSDLAARAGERALEDAGLSAADLDVIIVATATPDSPQPPTACLVQNLLGAARANAFDINAVCSGFVYGLDLARNHIAARGDARVLVIAADLYSRCLDVTDRRTAVLLADGAGAAVLGAADEAHGIVRIDLCTRGDQRHLIRVEAGGSRQPACAETVASGAHYFKMEGRAVRDFVLEQVPPALARTMAAAGIPPAEVAHLVPHQPNGMLLDELAERAGLPNARLHRTVERYGNLGSASVAVTLDQAQREGALADGDLVLLTAFGGGMSLGNCLLRWQDPATVR